MKHTPDTPEPAETASSPTLRHARLWAFAAQMLARMVDWFGSAAAIAAEQRVNARWVWDFAPAVKALEALVRRLVIAEALAMPARLTSKARAADGAGRGASRAPAPPWRGRLVIVVADTGRARAPALALSPPTRIASSLAAPRLSDPKTIDVLPYARRLDALQRVLANPRTPARALAARLRRSNAPRRRLPRPCLSARTPRRDAYRVHLREAHAAAAAPPHRWSG